MSSSFPIFDIAGSSMAAQSVRLSTVASNLANADSVSSDPDSAFKARRPVFETAMQLGGAQSPGVRVAGIHEDQTPALKRYEPGNPLADADGNVYASNVNEVEQMVDMISASRSYQNSVDVMNSAKDMAMKTLSLGS